MKRSSVQRPRWAALAAVALLAALVVAAGEFAGVFGGADRAAVSARFEIRGTQHQSDVTVVGIDDRSFGELRRRWPFPRSLHARAIDRLRAAGPRLIVYDVQFTEPTAPAEDLALYSAVQRAGNVVLATSESDAHGHTQVLGGDANVAAAHASVGAANLVNDPGGNVSRFPYSVAGLRSLAVATTERIAGRPFSHSGFVEGSAWIDYRGGRGSAQSLSFADVVRGRFNPAAVRGKIVIVGAVAPTLQDVHATPLGSELMSGPEVQANAIWSALHGLPLRSAALWVALLCVALLIAAPLAARMRFGTPAALLAAVLGGAGYLVAAQLAFDAGTILPVAAPLAALALAAVGMILASHLAEGHERQRVTRDNDLLEQRVRDRTAALERSQLEVVRRLAIVVESRDAETGHHIDRIAALAARLALAAGLAPRQAEMIGHAAALHDVGKIAIPDHILLKPGKLDEVEWRVMKTHTTEGGRILAGSQSALVQLGEMIALTHHERWDGGGYPAGLKGAAIPIEGRIVAICDAYDAMTSKRPYKDASSAQEALAEIERQAGGQFDPALVERFLSLQGELLNGALRSDQAGDALNEWTVAPDQARASAR